MEFCVVRSVLCDATASLVALGNSCALSRPSACSVSTLPSSILPHRALQTLSTNRYFFHLVRKVLSYRFNSIQVLISKNPVQNFNIFPGADFSAASWCAPSDCLVEASILIKDVNLHKEKELCLLCRCPWFVLCCKSLILERVLHA